MIKSLKYAIIFLSIILAGCQGNSDTGNTKNNKKAQTDSIVNLYADTQTEAVKSGDDAADDAAIWINSFDPEKSTIIGTNKQSGIVVYNLDGKLLYEYPVGKTNNVDIRYNFPFNQDTLAIVAATNRSNNSITVFTVTDSTGALNNVSGEFKINMPEVYGFGMYESKITGDFYGIIVGKNGEIAQYKFVVNNDKIDGELVREFNLASQGEGVVADDYHAKLYIGEENSALWKFEAEPDSSNQGKIIAKVSDVNMKDDFEGVTIYQKANGEGYIILSSQGNNSYAIFDRVTNKYINSFRLADGDKIDGTYDTDGIDVSNYNFGNKYPYGLFIAQDGDNSLNGVKENQNFKIISFKIIADSLNLTIDNTFDYR